MSFFKSKKPVIPAITPQQQEIKQIKDATMSVVPVEGDEIETYEDPMAEETTSVASTEEILEDTENNTEDTEIQELKKKLALREAELAEEKRQEELQKQALKAQNPPINDANSKDNIYLGSNQSELKVTREQLISFAEELEVRLQKIESFLFRGAR